MQNLRQGAIAQKVFVAVVVELHQLYHSGGTGGCTQTCTRDVYSKLIGGWLLLDVNADGVDVTVKP